MVTQQWHVFCISLISFLDPHSREDVHLKLMVPSCAAGAVIGKGGETIGKLQRDTGAKMKMSKNQDTFPGMVGSIDLKTRDMIRVFLDQSVNIPSLCSRTPLLWV